MPKIPSDTDSARPAWLGSVRPGRDLIRFGLALLLATAFGAVQVFVLPRRLSIITYGQYRAFLVYVSYLGILHFGLVDGAYLRWAGRPVAQITREWKTIGRWVVALESAVVVIAIAAAAVLDNTLLRLDIIALALCAFFANATFLSAYALQAAGDFRAAGRVAAAPPALIVVGILMVPMDSLASVLGVYVIAYAGTAVYSALLVVRMMRADSPAQIDTRDGPHLATLFRTGVHVLGAGVAAALAQSADRLMLSITRPMASFALYGFASTVTVMGGYATQALSRVALSHAAHQPETQRARFFIRFYDLIAAAYGLGLLGEPAFEAIVVHMLPEYQDALPILRALVVGLPVAVATQVVLVGTLQSHTHVRRQSALVVSSAMLMAVMCGVCITLGAPLRGVAATASMSAVVAFALGIWMVVSRVPTFSTAASIRFLVLVALEGAAMLLANTVSAGWPLRTALLCLLAAAPTMIALRAVRKQGW